MQSHASSETVFDDLELFCSVCHWLRKISKKFKKIRQNFTPLGVSEINNEILQRKNTITAETNVHEFKSVETRYDFNISGNCCCFSWCFTQVISLNRLILIGKSRKTHPEIYLKLSFSDYHLFEFLY